MWRLSFGVFEINSGGRGVGGRIPDSTPVDLVPTDRVGAGGESPVCQALSAAPCQYTMTIKGGAQAAIDFRTGGCVWHERACVWHGMARV